MGRPAVSRRDAAAGDPGGAHDPAVTSPESPESVESMESVESEERSGYAVGRRSGGLLSLLFVGIALVLVIDRFLPEPLNPNETEGRESELSSDQGQRRTSTLLRSGLLVAVVLALHNFPEGMATFIATYSDPALGLTLATAIAIHNVPEGIAVAAPVYAATGSRSKAFWWATASGLTEPLGGLLAAVAAAATTFRESQPQAAEVDLR